MHAARVPVPSCSSLLCNLLYWMYPSLDVYRLVLAERPPRLTSNAASSSDAGEGMVGRQTVMLETDSRPGVHRWHTSNLQASRGVNTRSSGKECPTGLARVRRRRWLACWLDGEDGLCL